MSIQPRPKIHLGYYQEDQELLGKAHREMQERPDLYDWLVEFRNAQRKEPKLCEPSHLYATVRQLFIATDESNRAKKLQAIAENKAMPTFNLSSALEHHREENALRDNKTAFKAQITALEKKLQENARKQVELEDIAAAFKSLTDTK